jgi:hypothetical protein
MEMKVEKTKAMRISWQPSPVTDQNQLVNAEYFKLLGCTKTTEATCTVEII